VTKLSASAFSASDQSKDWSREGHVRLGKQDVHVWLSSRDQFPTSDAFLRRVLSRYCAVSPLQWQFVRGEHGKPALVSAPISLDFNLSHSGDLLACAVTSGTPVGVDLEKSGPQRDVMRLARRFFRAEEIAALESCDTASQCDRFYDYWTLKEAAVKCRGEALVSGLDSRGFALTAVGDSAFLDGRITLTLPDEADTSCYGLLDPYPDYRLAICCLPGTQLQPKLQLFEMCHRGAATPLTVPLRASTWRG
jgi:4'-phosphopantetheinyl transferase